VPCLRAASKTAGGSLRRGISVSGTAHISEIAAGLASLPASDPERAIAYVHARECRDCALALQQGEQLMARLDAVSAPPEPQAPVRHAIAARILARLAALVVPARLLSVALVAVWLTLVFTAKHRAGGTPSWIESAALLAVAAGCVALVRRIGSP